MKVLLIHGLGRSPLSMLSLSHSLKRSGYQPESFGYAAFAQSYGEIVERLRDRLHTLADQGPYGIVAHSLGGVLTRSALAMTEKLLPHHVVMLGTPNQPPRLAKVAWQLWPFQWFSGTCGASLASHDFYAELPHLRVPYTIIAGTSGPQGAFSPFGSEVNDGIVALNETRILDHDQPVRFPGIHGFMMNQPTVQATVAKVLQPSNSQ